ncbi:hypothetical protein CKO25_04260 [Thiocapsa imhoffii]|uniref:Uncharacterized protein n=1 Tax=Thiocapsa imhoffii TaxID=382777 RepID=A0A9X0WG06_9GAMM|nr:hypothetical protein [Thiocapsa imhoffii]
MPLVIDVKNRKRDLDTLAEYRLTVGRLVPQEGVWPRPELQRPFMAFCEGSYAATRALVSGARAQQAKRGR